MSLPSTWRRLAELWLYFLFLLLFYFQAIIMIQIATKPWLTLSCDEIRLWRNRIWQEILAGQEQVETVKHTYIQTSNTSFLLAIRTWPGLQRLYALILTREPVTPGHHTVMSQVSQGYWHCVSTVTNLNSELLNSETHLPGKMSALSVPDSYSRVRGSFDSRVEVRCRLRLNNRNACLSPSFLSSLRTQQSVCVRR